MVFCNNRVCVMLIFLISIISLAFAVVPSTEPCWVKGTVTGSGVTVEDLNVKAYDGSTLLMEATISDGNYSLNSLGANTGDTITLKVLGATFDTFTFDGFCKTSADPWVVRDFNVSKQANGTTCSSATICTSGYCNVTCQTQSTGGNTGGSTGGTPSGGTDQSSVTTISDTNETISYTPLELQTALEGMDNEQGTPLFTSAEIAAMVANSSNYEFTRTVLVQKIVSSTGTVTYKITVTTTVKNKTSGDLTNVKVIVEVPKDVTNSASNVQSLIPFTTLVNDPVLKFNLASLKAGQEADIVYTVTSSTEFDLNGVEFADPTILSATKVTPTIPDTKPDTTPDVTPDTTPGTTPVAPMDYTLLIILVIVLVVVVAGYLLMGKKQKKGNLSFN